MTERAVILSSGETLGIKDFPIRIPSGSQAENIPASATLRETEIKMIQHALRQCEYNQKAAAEILGITRDALIRKLKKYNITIKRGIES